MPDLGRPRTALTRRGRWLLTGGATLLACGALLGEGPVVQLAVFVLALPLVSAVLVTRERFRLAVERTVTPGRVSRGKPADVALEVTGFGPRTGGIWLLTEHLPNVLGRAPRFTVTGLGSGRQTLRYRVTPPRRGRYVLGPLATRVMDPFGLVERAASGTEGTPLLVLPRVQPLGSVGPREGRDSGEGARRSIAVHGEDDVSIREYRRGDDLRKVHWRATARTGELKVRLEERPWRARASVLLDTRAPAHLIARRDTAALDSLEWAVEAAATIAVALMRRGTEVRLLTDSGELGGPSTAPPGMNGVSTGALLDRLAALNPSRRTDLRPGAELMGRGTGEGQVVCLLGALGPADVAHLTNVGRGATSPLAVLLDLGSWVPVLGGSRSGASSAVSALAEQREEAAARLRAAGWEVTVAHAGDPVARVWAALAGRTAAHGAGTPA